MELGLGRVYVNEIFNINEESIIGIKLQPDIQQIYKEQNLIILFHFEVREHHIKVYAGNHDTGGILRAEVPLRLLSHRILTPELAGAIINAKYVNYSTIKMTFGRIYMYTLINLSIILYTYKLDVYKRRIRTEMKRKN